eukprot:COSAG03_NODE_2345_length_2863_cov_33.607698_4_plen_224_part_00
MARCGQHTHYADGQLRPLMRGWLHTILALATVPVSVFWFFNGMSRVLAPTLFSLCWLLVFSSSLHMIPWRWVTLEDYICRLDRLGVVLITVNSFFAPQLLGCECSCRPAMSYTVWFNLLPNAVSGAMILYGAQMNGRPSTLAFAGTTFSCVAMALYWIYTSNFDLLGYEMAVVSLDAVGMYVYAVQMGGPQPTWGFHEWMHLSVGIGFYINMYLVHVISQRCA